MADGTQARDVCHRRNVYSRTCRRHIRLHISIALTRDCLGVQRRYKLKNLAEYEGGSEVFRTKIAGLERAYSGMRRTRGDGNCFFRSFIFAYIEDILQRKDFNERHRSVTDDCVFATSTKDFGLYHSRIPRAFCSTRTSTSGTGQRNLLRIAAVGFKSGAKRWKVLAAHSAHVKRVRAPRGAWEESLGHTCLT